MSTEPTAETSSPSQGSWKGPLLAFAGGALAGLLILPFLPSRDPSPTETEATVPQGRPIVDLDERASASREPSATSSAARETDRNGFQSVGFDVLAGFTLTGQTRLPGATGGDLQSPSIPDHILALNGERLVVEGFMLPIRVDREAREVREMFLMKDHSLCCFGEEPEANEYIYVQLEKGTGVPILTELPVRLYGEFEVRTNPRDIQMEGLYRMRGVSYERL
ncbi:MAG: DUF3299 domain-containing protein [Opitutales bacterium]|nr:DUF3299 domain-containing protein [Opitutales bacterium]MCH8540717.1 DUF3299 domain-containing protein [Opitutales bacterium]